MGGMMEAKVANFEEPVWQDVLEEAMQELKDGQSHFAGLAGIGLAIAEGDGSFIVMQDGRVGQGDTVDVACEVLQRLLAIAHGFYVHHPVNVPDLGRNGSEGFWDEALHSGLEPRTEEAGERWRRRQESVFGPVPGASFIESAAGNEIMDVGMICHCARPGMQHGGSPWNCPEPGRIQAQIHECAGRCAKEQ